MSDSLEKSWSESPNAPPISYYSFLAEKENLAGSFIGAIFYGIDVILFFLCMRALLDPLNRIRRGLKCGLVVHITAMFSFVTIYTAMTLHLQSISYIDNRKFSGGDREPSGPLGYQSHIYSKPISVIPNATFPLNQWLADGLLLYQCYVVYSMNCWAVAFPSLMYIASMVTGVMIIYHQAVQPHNEIIGFGIPYYLISLLLNVLLTAMIVIRLIGYSVQDSQPAAGPLVRRDRYKTIVTILVESSALYAISFVLYIVPWSAESSLQLIFFPILAHIQVIAPLLIILRASKQKTPKNSAILSRDNSLVRANQAKSTGGHGFLPHSHPVRPMSANRGTRGIRIELALNSHDNQV